MSDTPDAPKPPDLLTAPFKTFAELHDVGNDSPPPKPGLSFTPGLEEVPDSKVPAYANGEEVSHVFGPGQAAVDPVAAGLDTEYRPLTRAENRVVTQTGELGAGPRPTTYAEKDRNVPQAGPADGASVPAPSDAEAAATPGPGSAAPTE